MDILAHGLWAGAAAKAVNLRRKAFRGASLGTTRDKQGKSFNAWLAAFWGMFPDLFAFTIPFVWFFLNLVTGNVDFSDLHKPGTGAQPEDKLLFGNGDTQQAQPPIAYFASVLYSISHSVVVFAAVVALVIIARKLLKMVRRAHHKEEGVVPWEMGGWLLHILLDVPTHSYAFYPTPVFWPLIGWKFDGYTWGRPWFMVANYSAIAVAYLTIRYFEKKKVNIG